MSRTALILGSRGRFGRHCTTAFEAAGWQVRRFDRGRDALSDAAAGAAVIVNGWNPPYARWAADLPGQTAQIVDAARRSGATVLQPANVYVYGRYAPATLDVDTPHRATNPLGRLRIETEAALRDAGLRVILLRAGDFLDTAASGNWFDRVIAAPLARGRIDYPGRDDIDHAWAYLPDLARAAVALAERRADLATVEEVPYPGYTLTGQDIAARLAATLGRSVRVRRMRWWPLRLAAPVAPMLRGLIEMRYLWDKPHRIAPEVLRRLVPDHAPTPVDRALARAVGQPQIDPDRPVG